MSNSSQLLTALSFQLKHIGGVKDWSKSEALAHVDEDTLNALLETAADFAESRLAPLAASADLQGCKLHGHRVRLPEGTREVYEEWRSLGFPSLGLPPHIDGLGLPNAALCAIQELCDGANLALGMLFINLRCAALALLKSASADQQQKWLPGLVSGSLASTIAISEPQAGSDVGRIRTLAQPQADGSYLITGTKIWISYGDHDATDDILHLALARLPDSEAGSRGLSLFAVPVSNANRNGVSVQRIEHKMGLHASPTCVLEFIEARGEMIGEAGKGLAALFTMMNAMRLAVAVQGASIANAATSHALQYASERPQGGHPTRPAVNIIEHTDVQRMLLEMIAESELLRAQAMRIAALLDQAAASKEITESSSQRLAEFLLPIAKTYNSETAFVIANMGIQVLGGYGYTSDYPLERMARDIRVASIYEGTSGIQALDLVKRKLLGDHGAVFAEFLEQIDTALTSGKSDFQIAWPQVREELSALASQLIALSKDDLRKLESATYPFLQLAAVAVNCWNGHLLQNAADPSEFHQHRLAVALRYYASSVTAKAALWGCKARSELPSLPTSK